MFTQDEVASRKATQTAVMLLLVVRMDNFGFVWFGFNHLYSLFTCVRLKELTHTYSKSNFVFY